MPGARGRSRRRGSVSRRSSVSTARPAPRSLGHALARPSDLAPEKRKRRRAKSQTGLEELEHETGFESATSTLATLVTTPKSLRIPARKPQGAAPSRSCVLVWARSGHAVGVAQTGLDRQHTSRRAPPLRTLDGSNTASRHPGAADRILRKGRPCTSLAMPANAERPTVCFTSCPGQGQAG